MSGSPLPQASRIDEGEGSRGASDPHALPPGEGQAVGLHAVAEEHEGFGANNEAEILTVVQEALGVLDSGLGRGPGLTHEPRERARGRRG